MVIQNLNEEKTILMGYKNLLIFIFILLYSCKQNPKREHVFDNAVSFELPIDFRKMSEEDLTSTFSIGNQPDFAYKSKEDKVYFSVRKTDYETYNEEIPEDIKIKMGKW